MSAPFRSTVLLIVGILSLILSFPQAQPLRLDVREITSVAALNDITEVEISRDGSTAAAISNDGNLYIITSSGSSHGVSLGEGIVPKSVAITENGDRILCVDSNSDIHLFDSAGNELCDPYTPWLDSEAYSVDITPDGSYAVVSTNLRIICFNLQHGDLQYEWSSYSFSQCMVDSSSDGQYILVYDDEKLNVLDGDGDILWSDDWKPSGNGKIVCADLSEDGSKIAALSDNRILYLLDAHSGNETWRVTNFGQTNKILEGIVELSRDGSVIIAGHDFGPRMQSIIYVYHSDSSHEVATYYGAAILAAGLSDDGKYLVIQTQNTTGYGLRLIDLGKEEAVWETTINDYIESTSNLAISGDGCFVAYGDSQYYFSHLTAVPRTTLSYSGAVVVHGTHYFSREGRIQLSATYIGEHSKTYWSMDGGDYREYEGPIDLSSFNDGQHTLSYYSVDSHNNREDTRVFSFWLDKTPPAITIISPQEGVWVPPTLTVSWNSTDPGCGVDYYNIELDGIVVAGEYESTTYVFRDLREGPHTITVHAYDRVGNRGTGELHVRVDPNPPSLMLVPDVAEVYINSDSYILQWNSTDPLSGIKQFELSVDNRSRTTISSEQRKHILTDLDEGRHYVVLKAIDNAGNEVEKHLYITVDFREPFITISNVIPVYLNPSRLPFVVSWSAGDRMRMTGKETGIRDITVRIRNIDSGETLVSENVGKASHYTIKNLTEGRIELVITAYDKAGNNATARATFIYDETPPSITFSYKFEKISNDVYVKVVGRDKYAGIERYEISVNGDDWREMGMDEVGNKTIGDYTIYAMDAGDHKIYIKAVDRAGNDIVKEYTIHIGFVEANVFELGVCLPTLVIFALIIFIIIRRFWRGRRSNKPSVEEESVEVGVSGGPVEGSKGMVGSTRINGRYDDENLSYDEKIKRARKLRRRAYRRAEELIEKGFDVTEIMGVLSTASQAERRGNFDLAYRATRQAWEMLKERYGDVEE